MKMKETRTVKGSPECPTLLHYVARTLLGSNPNFINFADDLPHLEAAARGLIIEDYARLTAHQHF